MEEQITQTPGKLTPFSSTPIGTIHWYLLKFQPWRRRAIVVVHITYLAIYGLCRVYLVYWTLHNYALSTDLSVIDAFESLPWHCRLGLGTIAGANTTWLSVGIRRFARRYLSL